MKTGNEIVRVNYGFIIYDLRFVEIVFEISTLGQRYKLIAIQQCKKCTLLLLRRASTVEECDARKAL
jgi:hypothetical protein